jgi:chromosome segregation ATPase
MTSDSTTRWPLLEERGPFATAGHRDPARKLPRSVWLLTGLAFLCGGLVSAAGFSIGWRHQAQRDTAAQAALAAANARTHRLERRVSALRTSLDASRTAAAKAAASEHAVGRAAARVENEATASGSAAASVSSGAGSLTAAATRLAGELKTLDTYLTTTPTTQLDPGYISTQAAYLARQLTRLQGNSADLSTSLTTLEAALRKLSRDASALRAH